MVIHLEILKPNLVHSSIDEIARFVIENLSMEVKLIEEFESYPDEILGTLTYSEKLIDNSNFVRIKDCDYRIYHGTIDEHPFMMILTYNAVRGNYEYQQFHFTTMTSKEINWDYLFSKNKNSFGKFCKKFYTLLSNIPNVTKGYIGEDQDDGINFDNSWFLYYRDDNIYVADILKFLTNFLDDDYNVKPWLNINKDQIKDVLNSIHFAREEIITSLYSLDEPIHNKRKIKRLMERREGKQTMIRKILMKLSSKGFVKTHLGSICFYGESANSNSVRQTTSHVVNMFRAGIQSGIDFETIINRIKEGSNKYIDDI